MTGAVGATIEVGGALEEAVEDAAAKRVYVNVEDKNAIAVVDAVAHKMVATWTLDACDGPTGLAFDAKNHLLLAACDGSTAIVDSTSGKTVAHFPIADARRRQRLRSGDRAGLRLERAGRPHDRA